MMQHAIVYKRADSWYLHASAETTDGVWIATQPFLKVPTEANLCEVGEAIETVLKASSQGVPHPEEWNGVFQPMLGLAGVKSWPAFMKGSLCLRLESTGGVLVITPTKNLGPKEGHLPLENKVLRLPNSSASHEIGQAAQSAISICE